MKCSECKQPFRDAYLKLPGVKRKGLDGKDTDYWPVCEACRPTVWMRYVGKYLKGAVCHQQEQQPDTRQQT